MKDCDGKRAVRESSLILLYRLIWSITFSVLLNESGLCK